MKNHILRADPKEDQEEIENLKWKLENSKQCPQCFILINKEPEGCNKMDCLHCGFEFCWNCEV
jgi:uncharacterized ferredoxin-like protein